MLVLKKWKLLGSAFLLTLHSASSNFAKKGYDCKILVVTSK